RDLNADLRCQLPQLTGGSLIHLPPELSRVRLRQLLPARALPEALHQHRESSAGSSVVPGDLKIRVIREVIEDSAADLSEQIQQDWIHSAHHVRGSQSILHLSESDSLKPKHIVSVV